MDRNEVKRLRVALERAIKAVSDEFDMDIKVGSISYGSEEFHCKIEGLARGAMPLTAKHYKIMATNDMPELGAKILLQGTEYKVVGWKKRASKYPVIIEDNTGKRYKISRGMLLDATVLD